VTSNAVVRLGYFYWSPDASFLAYTSCSVATDVYSRQVWKTRSDGTGKPVRLIGDSDFYSIQAWRR
jgi:hypothetical protein